MREQNYVPAICLARIYSRVGETEKAIEERNGEMVFLKSEIEDSAEGDALHSLTGDPRITNLLQKMNLPES